MSQNESSPLKSSSSSLQVFSMMSLSPSLGSSYPWLKELKSEERGLYLIHLLLTCANHVATGSLENANIALEQISELASPDGDTMQRIAAYFTEALADRILKTWPGLHKAINSTRVVDLVSEQALVRRLFFEVFPFLKAAFLLVNQAIIEAMEGEKVVHVIDLDAAEPMQWIALIRGLSARPEGPPHLRITGIHVRKEVLDQMGHRLSEEAEKLDIPFQFNPVVGELEDLDVERLHVKTGEAVAISSVLRLHSLLASDDEPLRKKLPLALKNSNGIHLQRALQMSQNTLGELLEKDTVNGYSPSPDSASSSPLSSPVSPKVDTFLTALRGLLPKLVVITEQDSNHNGSTLMERLLESLHSYAALFDCLESTVSRASSERLKLEKMLFGNEIKNIISCEGAERKERHEKLEKWIQRLDSAGFSNVPLSYYGMLQAKTLLQGYNCDGYKMKDENGCVMICWQDRPMFSVSAWRCRNSL
ncbi:scarecrow-like protein 3 [Gossypium australe]|uniref:Scarecrow-like protein 3 n=1 Tax=Gossypium australe TaxID=47621 RepID=A0A5B6WYM9_9ROSI|nr:scarecrow-like protein 3 [Gossypium australe]